MASIDAVALSPSSPSSSLLPPVPVAMEREGTAGRAAPSAVAASGALAPRAFPPVALALRAAGAESGAAAVTAPAVRTVNTLRRDAVRLRGWAGAGAGAGAGPGAGAGAGAGAEAGEVGDAESGLTRAPSGWLPPSAGGTATAAALGTASTGVTVRAAREGLGSESDTGFCGDGPWPLATEAGDAVRSGGPARASLPEWRRVRTRRTCPVPIIPSCSHDSAPTGGRPCPVPTSSPTGSDAHAAASLGGASPAEGASVGGSAGGSLGSEPPAPPASGAIRARAAASAPWRPRTASTDAWLTTRAVRGEYGGWTPVSI